MRSVIISNLVYGEPYTTVFLELHLKSLLENFNQVALGENSMYLIYTDGSNIGKITDHRSYKSLSSIMQVQFIKIDDQLNYQGRYHAQTLQFQHSIKIALERNSLMHQACADIYYGSNFWSNSFQLLAKHNANGLFGFAIRTTLESTYDVLRVGYFDNDSLFEIGYSNIHPIWSFANWESPYFTKYPYTFLWSSPDQIVCRAFSIPPIIFEPTDKMMAASGCGDISVLPLCERIYIERDWQILPMLEVGMMQAFFPPFSTQRSSVEKLVAWARRHLPAENHANLVHYQVIKKRDTVIDQSLIEESSIVCKKIMEQLASPF